MKKLCINAILGMAIGVVLGVGMYLGTAPDAKAALALISLGYDSLADLPAGNYEVVNSTDVNGDGVTDLADALFVKSCINSTEPRCDGVAQAMTVTGVVLQEGVVIWQRVGNSHVRGNDKVTLGDALFVRSCVGSRAEPCCGSLIVAETVSISGTVLDQDGNPVPGVEITATTTQVAE